MKKIILAVGISLIVGFAAASWMETTVLSSGPEVTEPSKTGVSAFDVAAPVEDRIRALEQAVMDEREARFWLEEEVFVLREELERREEVPDEPVQASMLAREAVRAEFRNRRFGVSSSGAQVDRLVEAGFPPGQAEWIVQRESEMQMAQIEARYEAMRGEQGSRFFGMESNSEIRAGLGDADYERYLAATGRSTSAGIGSVIPNSPAQDAGLKPGDEIVRYDGERVFSMMDVAGRIMQNPSEGNVVVDIERGGFPMQLVIPRGPLGVTGN